MFWLVVRTDKRRELHHLHSKQVSTSSYFLKSFGRVQWLSRTSHSLQRREHRTRRLSVLGSRRNSLADLSLFSSLPCSTEVSPRLGSANGVRGADGVLMPDALCLSSLETQVKTMSTAATAPASPTSPRSPTSACGGTNNIEAAAKSRAAAAAEAAAETQRQRIVQRAREAMHHRRRRSSLGGYGYSGQGRRCGLGDGPRSLNDISFAFTTHSSSSGSAHGLGLGLGGEGLDEEQWREELCERPQALASLKGESSPVTVPFKSLVGLVQIARSGFSF